MRHQIGTGLLWPRKTISSIVGASPPSIGHPPWSLQSVVPPPRPLSLRGMPPQLGAWWLAWGMPMPAGWRQGKACFWFALRGASKINSQSLRSVLKITLQKYRKYTLERVSTFQLLRWHSPSELSAPSYHPIVMKNKINMWSCSVWDANVWRHRQVLGAYWVKS